MCIKNESSGAENDYSSKTDGTQPGKDKVLTPIVSLELEDLEDRKKNQNEKDDLDFFFNDNNNKKPSGGIIVRQDSKDSIDNYFKVGSLKLVVKPHDLQGSVVPHSRFSPHQDLFHPHTPSAGQQQVMELHG